MAIIGEAELKEQIKTNSISSVYMIYGEESYLKEYYVKKLKSAVVEPTFADFNLHEYEGRDTSINEILQDAEMLPMMAERSFLLVHDYPLDKSAGDMNELKEFFKDVPDTCVLVFWFDSIEVDQKKNSKWKTIIKHFEKAGNAVCIDKKTEGELVKLLVSYAKRHKCALDARGARYLVSVVGNDMKILFNELDKMCSYSQDGIISKEIIDRLATKSLQAKVFDLSKNILNGNSDGAYTILNNLLAQKESEIAIMSAISSCYIDMYRVKCAKAAGESEMNVGEYFSYRGREFLLRNAARDSRNVSFEGLRQAIDVLSWADELLKSATIEKRVVLEETIAKLLMLRNK